MTVLSYTASKISADQTQGAIVRNYVAAAALTVGDLVALDNSGALTQADGNGTAAVARAIGMIVNSTSLYGETAIASGQRCSVCVFGPVYGFSGLTPGAYGYVSDTAGKIEDTMSSTNALAVGRALAADTFFINPGVADFS